MYDFYRDIKSLRPVPNGVVQVDYYDQEIREDYCPESIVPNHFSFTFSLVLTCRPISNSKTKLSISHYQMILRLQHVMNYS
jgi:hypothetical protein